MSRNYVRPSPVPPLPASPLGPEGQRDTADRHGSSSLGDRRWSRPQKPHLQSPTNRRSADARHHRDNSASKAGHLQSLLRYCGQISPLAGAARAPERSDDTKAAARWQLTTGTNVSGTDSDREPARAPRRRHGNRTSSRPTSDRLSRPGSGPCPLLSSWQP